MARLLRVVFVPLLAITIGLGGVSYALTAATTAEEIPGDPPTDDGTVDDGTVDDGTTDNGTTDDGTVDDGTTDDGTVDDGTVDDGTVDDGTADDGTTDDGADGTEGAPTDTEADPCPEGFTGNHGQYVSSTPERPRRDAAHSMCGKPAGSVKNDPSDDEEVEPDDDDGADLAAAKAPKVKKEKKAKKSKNKP